MSDSLIRLRQINQSEFSGFIGRMVFPALKTSGLILSGHLIPTGSGIYDIGSAQFPYNHVYARELDIPSGSGIRFGADFFTVYSSGTDAVLKVNNITFTSSPTGLSIIGPSGATGPTGSTGATGTSGIGVTGAASVGGTGFRLLFSNATSGSVISLPTGPSGASGASLTGFSQSGNFVRPLFSNGTSGSNILLPSGARGLNGRVGGIVVDMSDFTGFSGNFAPGVFIYNIDSLGVTLNPDLNLIRGMSYDIGYSGLNLSTVTITGNGIDYSTGNFKSNYFVESGITGYLKFVFFDPAVTNLYSNPKTGRNLRQEIPGAVYSDILATVLTSNAAYNIVEDVTRAEQTFTVKLSSADEYRYGFQKYNFYTQQPIDSLGAWGFYVLGDAELSYFGPQGPSGSQGAQGIPGTQGERGLRGTDGAQGSSITGIERNGNDIRFILSDGTNTNWITLPTGGPTGPQGNPGNSGPVGNTGPTGSQGPSGLADRYSSSFVYTDTNFSGFSDVIYQRVSGASTWTLLSGTGRRFSVGDEIQFYNNGLLGKAYTSQQMLIFADTPSTRNQYFYGNVSDYNGGIGQISVIVQPSPAPIGLVSGKVNLDLYSVISVNLGGLGSVGPTGPSGLTGLQGSRGDTGNALFTINNPVSGLLKGTNTVNFAPNDALNLYLTGDSNVINFNFNSFSTGQTTLIRVANSGAIDNINTGPNPLIIWDSNIKFPYNVTAPSPNPGQSSLYTFIRFPDEGVNKRVFCTYSVNYA